MRPWWRVARSLCRDQRTRTIHALHRSGLCLLPLHRPGPAVRVGRRLTGRGSAPVRSIPMPGHDSLFFKKAKGRSTVLVAKGRVWVTTPSPPAVGGQLLQQPVGAGQTRQAAEAAGRGKTRRRLIETSPIWNFFAAPCSLPSWPHIRISSPARNGTSTPHS